MEKEVLFEAKGLTKDFSGNIALNHVSLHIDSGEIVGLVGENGAGKSTLLKILMGVQGASSGTMELQGKPYKPNTPREANDSGVGMVFQEQSLITNLTIGQNIFFGYENQFKRFGLINYKKMYAAAQEVLDSINIKGISPEKYVRDVNFAARQMVEIAKVVNLSNNAASGKAVILLDEPTSVLNDAEVEQLFEEMRKMAAKGHAVIFVSHRLDEILKITERIYVFKDGENVGEFQTRGTTETMLYEAMVGNNVTSEYYYTNLQSEPGEEVVLEAKNLGLFGAYKDVSFQLHKGEILGSCGVVGSGKEELCYSICGDLPHTAGELYINNRLVNNSSPAAALDHGVLMIPQERNTEGIIGMLSVSDNIAISDLSRKGGRKFISKKLLQETAAGWIEQLRIKTPGAKTPVESLSGGNAQKVVFARMLQSNSDIILLNHPTRGVDVGAKKEIYRLIREMMQSDKSMILLGDTLDECIEMSNRVLVMMDEKVAGDFAAPVGGKPSHLDVIQCMM